MDHCISYCYLSLLNAHSVNLFSFELKLYTALSFFFFYSLHSHCQLVRIHRLLTLLQISSFPTKFKAYMIDIVKCTMEHREANKISRKDFIQLLMELQETGKVSNDDDSNDANKTNESLNQPTTNKVKKMFTIEQCAGQVVLFYLAGFDTTASTVSFCLYELSRKPELMKRLQNEIDEFMTKNNDIITYEMVKEMPFLDLCFRGTLET